MRKMGKKLAMLIMVALIVLPLSACTKDNAEKEKNEKDKTDAVSAASEATGLYTNLDQAGVLEVMGQYAGLCNVATVNADGSPNIAVFVPGVADENHIMFGWADNATKRNVLRDKVAILSYDVANPAAEDKAGRHKGAVLKVELEEDESVLKSIRESNEAITEDYVILKIAEVLPIG